MEPALSSWKNEIIARVTGGKGKPRETGGQPSEYEFPPAFDAHPLMVMPPQVDLTHFRGMAVFCRLTQKGVPPADDGWKCLTMGEIWCIWQEESVEGNVGKTEQIPLTNDTVTAFVASESNGIQQGFLAYRMSRIGISQDEEIIQTVSRSQEVLNQASGEERKQLQPKKGEELDRRFVCYNLGNDHKWILIPGLRYSKTLRYEFAFAAIHNSGALPPGVAGSVDICRLPDSPELIRVPADHGIARPYRRRVPVGPPRFKAQIAGLKSGELPAKPANIALLADDLFNADVTHSGLRSPVARPQVIFLYGDDNDETAKLSIEIEASSLDRDIWRTWKLGTALTIPQNIKQPVMDLYAAARPPDSAQAQRLILFDPAVSGIHFSLCRVFPKPSNEDGANAMLGHYQPLTFMSDDEAPAERSLHIQDAWQRRKLKEKVIVSAIDGVGANAFIGLSDGVIQIKVPRGEVWSLKTAPCIAAVDLERFDIYPWKLNDDAPDASSPKSAKPSTARVTVLSHNSGKVVRINRAALNWRVEAALKYDKLIGQLPTEVDVWKVLQLERAPSFAQGSGGRLRAKLTIPPADLIKWCWVSDYRVEVQKWRWNGLPLGACGDWKSSVGPSGAVGMAGLLDLATESTNGALDIKDYAKAEIAETTGYGDRELNDVDPQEGKVNYAPLLLDVDLVPPETEVYLERGDAESEPCYYRVSIHVSHRYRALRDNLSVRSSATKIDDDKNYSTSTPWKRIILKGVGPGPLIAPRVKIVLPLMDSDSKDPKSRPGIVVLTRDSMPSPFHRLVATLELAERRIYDEKNGDLVSVDLLHEIGPDPVTSMKGFGRQPSSEASPKSTLVELEARDPRVAAQEEEENFVAKAKQKWNAWITGQAFGLTWEREANSPLFPHSGFFFDLHEFADQVGLDSANFAALLKHDLLAKLRFRWELDGRALWSRPLADGTTPIVPPYLKGPDSGPWWVRALSRFLPASSPDIKDFADIGFSYREDSEKKFAHIEFKNNRSFTSIPMRAPRYDSKDGVLSGELSAALLFVAWADISDGSSAAAARVVTDVHLVDARFPVTEDDKPFEKRISLMHQSPPAPIAGGQFMLVHFRAKRIGEKNDDLLDLIKKWRDNASAATMDEFSKLLFPEALEESQPTRSVDAKAMVVRSSNTIYPL